MYKNRSSTRNAPVLIDQCTCRRVDIYEKQFPKSEENKNSLKVCRHLKVLHNSVSLSCPHGTSKFSFLYGRLEFSVEQPHKLAWSQQVMTGISDVVRSARSFKRLFLSAFPPFLLASACRFAGLAADSASRCIFKLLSCISGGSTAPHASTSSRLLSGE